VIGAERRWRTAVLASIVPALGELDLDAFWRRFDRAAPLHLALAMRAAAIAIGGIAPRTLGHAATLESLDPDAREDVIQRAARTPLVSELVEVAKIVACLAYFADPAVEAAARRR
jgi:hypothetical protein